MGRNIRTGTQNTLSDQVYEAIRGKILKVELKPFENLSEAMVSKEFGVSRTPVREAFLRLADQGFLEIRPQRGTYVAPLRLQDLMQSQFMREAFEVALVRRAVTLADNSDLCAALQRELKLQRVYSDIGDQLAFSESDEAFHLAIAVHCGFPEFWNEVQRVKQHMDRIRHIIFSMDDTERVVNQHERIADAICRRDEEAAVRQMVDHLQRVGRLIGRVEVDFPEYFRNGN